MHVTNKAWGLTAALICTGMTVFADVAGAQSTAATPDTSEPAPYCTQLQEIATLAMSKEHFASIIGNPREGNFLDTKRSLPGWKDCAFYGPTTYTCDSFEFKSDEGAAQAEATTAHQILACLRYWDRAEEQTSGAVNFVVLHPRIGPASITLNLDKADSGKPVVRLILFLRRR